MDKNAAMQEEGTQTVPLLPKIGAKETVLRWKDRTSSWLQYNARSLARGVVILGVASGVVASGWYLGMKLWRHVTPVQTIPVALPDLPKPGPQKKTAPSKSGTASKTRSAPAPRSKEWWELL